jgi:hypothetical protein
MHEEFIKSIEMFIHKIKQCHKMWPGARRPWFRGQRVDEPLLPRLFRQHYDENELVQIFRMKSPMLYETPNINEWDKWLCLMQHAGAPTRLLDWTEGALIALYFAIYKYYKEGSDPVVWMMEPLILNQLSINQFIYPLSFSEPGIKNFHYAFDKGAEAYEKPVALYPVELHIRMSVQKSCFTIHGIDTQSIEAIFSNTHLIKDNFLIKFHINIKSCQEMLSDLRTLGISHSTLFPDLDGLGFELSQYKMIDTNLE